MTVNDCPDCGAPMGPNGCEPCDDAAYAAWERRLDDEAERMLEALHDWNFERLHGE